MSTTTDAIQVAESVFRAYGDHHANKGDSEKAKRNYELAEQMRAALLASTSQEFAQQEPVAWMYEWNGRTHITTADQRPIEHAHPHFNKSKPLYAAPQHTAQQNPVAWKWRYKNGELSVASFDTRAQCERNSDDTAGEAVPLYTQPQPPVQQEPVAWRVRPFDYGIGYEGVDALTTRKEQCEMWERKGWKVEPLYAAPQLSAQPEPEQQKPVAWIDVKPNPFDPLCRGAASVQDHALPPGEHKLYAAPQPTENLRCKSTQKRLATLWGYVKKEPDHFRDATQMVSVSQMLEVLRTKYSDLIYESNQKMAVHFEEDIFTINDFLQRIQQEAAEKARQPLTDEQMYSLYCEAMKGYYVSALHYWRNEEAHKFARAIEEVVWKQNS